ncbi:asparaginase [Saccharospirillum mangrovi]|uniref:asparaginase n=1 Tax=Saccharospirillum mangrovi TaxID=2161747 RepID=UPI000D33E8CC|nr:asparaginase [Saccharospirillum mangrovi]
MTQSNNPVLVQVIRGGAVESEHRGRALVMTPDGDTLWSVGDVNALTYPRSAIKAFQALPMLAAGAHEAFGLDDEELALCCASHNGEPEHVAVADRFLGKLSLHTADFECGVQWPYDQQAMLDIARQQRMADARHNNCSGKHLGMLALARHQGWPTEGYVSPDHPVQQAIRHCIETSCDTELSGVPLSPDGCTAPTWAMPLHRLALGFARFAAPDTLPAEYRAGARRLYRAATTHPFLVEGSDRFCTEAMRALKGAAFLKIGAEGVFIAALSGLQLGVALKMDSGSSDAAEVAVAAILNQLGLVLPERWQRPPILNRNGLVTGQRQPVTEAFIGLNLSR